MFCNRVAPVGRALSSEGHTPTSIWTTSIIFDEFKTKRGTKVYGEGGAGGYGRKWEKNKQHQNTLQEILK